MSHLRALLLYYKKRSKDAQVLPTQRVRVEIFFRDFSARERIIPTNDIHSIIPNRNIPLRTLFFQKIRHKLIHGGLLLPLDAGSYIFIAVMTSQVGCNFVGHVFVIYPACNAEVFSHRRGLRNIVSRHTITTATHRHTQTHKHTNTHRQTHTHTDTDRHTQTHHTNTHTRTHPDTQTHTNKHTHPPTHTPSQH